MTDLNAPPRVDARQLAEIERRPGKDSAVYRRALERHEDWEAHLAENKRENDRLRAERERRTDAAQRARAAERADAAEAELRERLRSRFFAGSPAATEADFARLYPQLRDDHLLDEAGRAPEREQAELRATGQYRT